MSPHHFGDVPPHLDQPLPTQGVGCRATAGVGVAEDAPATRGPGRAGSGQRAPRPYGAAPVARAVGASVHMAVARVAQAGVHC